MLKPIKPGSLTDLRGGFTWSSSELQSEIQRRVQHLERACLRPGQSVLILESNSASFFATLLAVWSMGVCAVPADPRLPEMALAKTRALIRPRLTIRADGSWQEHPEFTNEIPLPEDSALVLLTSGSTAEPKGVLHSYQALQSKLTTLQKHLSGAEFAKTFCGLPTYFGHGLICNSLGPWLAGSHLHIGGFDISLLPSFAEMLEQHQITFFSSTPSLWAQIASWPAPKKNSLRRVHCASALLDEKRHHELRAWIGEASFWNVYGLTEFLGWVAGCEIKKNHFHTGEMGSPWDTEVSFGADDEILLRAPFQLTKYLNSEQSVHPWFATGDKGFLQDGHLFLSGRLNNRINKAGLKIQPEEIESLLASCPLVKESCCFPLQDESWGQKIGLAVVLPAAIAGGTASIEALKKSATAAGSAAFPATAAEPALEIRQWLAARVAPYKIPDRVWILERLPVDSRGKLKRREIADQLGKENESSGS